MNRVRRSQVSTAGPHGGTAARIALASLLFAAAGASHPAPAGAQGRPAPAAVALEGTLDVLYEDAYAGGRLVHFLQTGTRRVPLRFRGVPPEMPSGSRVRVTGDLADGAVTTSSVTMLEASTSQTMGAQDVLVILMNFASNPTQPYTPASTATVNDQVRAMYLENSYGQVTMTFTVTPWVTIRADTSTCGYSTWSPLADAAAAAAGYDVSLYDRIVYAFPSVSACAWWGMGNVQGPRSWINGTYATRVVAHEQAHNFGDYHSRALQCDAGGCASIEYGDDRDVLGAATTGHLNAFQKERLGWLNYGSSPPIQTVSTTNTYWVEAYARAGAGMPKALKIWNAAAGNYYYVETRTQNGFDSAVPAGVTIHTGSPTSGNTSNQLDLDAATSARDTTLDPGQVFADAALGVTISTVSADASGALVQVVFAGPSCATSAPTVTLSPSDTVWGPTGAPLAFTVSLKNNDRSTCAPTSFSLATVVPGSAWAVTYAGGSGSLGPVSPGATVTKSLTITAPAGAAGSYAFTANAVDGTSTVRASASGSVVVASSLAVVASAVRTSTATTISISVKIGALAVPGATVSVTVSAPRGKPSTYTATTAADGTATVSFKSSTRDAKGTWQVNVTASKGGIRGSATTSFVVP